MKYLIFASLIVSSVSASEISANKCAVKIDGVEKKWVLTNTISKNDFTIDANCLDLVKGASEETNQGTVQGVILHYTNPN